mgnify:CR=1 FL=1
MKTADQFNAANFDLGQLIKDIAVTNHAMLQQGIDIERERLLPLLQAIIAAYDRALGDPTVRLPSPLMAAIVVAQKEVGAIRIAGTKAPDMPGRPSDDISARGTQLKPGS